MGSASETATQGERTFEVRGMSCASCARRVEKALAQTPGVIDAGVNLALETATVRAESAVGDDRLAEAVRSAGYELVSRPAVRDRGLTEDDPTHGGRGQHEHGISVTDEDARTRSARRRFLVAAVLTAPVLALAMAGIEAGWARLLAWALTTPIEFWAGRQFLTSALRQARHLSSNMDTLIAVGTLAAYGYSVYSMAFGGAVYFETAAVIVTFLLLGKYLEHRSKGRAAEAIRKLLELGSKDAILVRDDGEVTIPIGDVSVGDVLRVRPGAKVPTDGIVRDGRAYVDESMFTGEAVPVEKDRGDDVFGGTIAAGGSLLVEATRIGSETALAQIVALVEDAQRRKASIERLADKVASVFVPVVIVVAGATLAGWLITGHAFEPAMLAAIAVMIIACPCALGLATPAAVMVGTGRGAQAGILIKGGDVLERSASLDVVLLDKTGTITTGEMVVTDVVPAAGSSEEDVLRHAAAVEAPSEHPVARAIVESASRRRLALPQASDFASETGRGVTARVGGRTISVGRKPAHLDASLARVADGLGSEGKTVVWVEEGSGALGLVAVADEPKASSRRAVARLHELGLDTILITGDNAAAAKSIARRVGIADVVAEVNPEEKVNAVQRLQAAGKRVAMVGDGVNDAPALARADLGIAIGTGTDVAIEAADLTLVGGDPVLAPAAIELARRTFATIKGNLFWAFFYNAAMIPLAAAGLLDPMFAAAAMAFSSVSVVLNALRLKRFRLHL